MLREWIMARSIHDGAHHTDCPHKEKGQNNDRRRSNTQRRKEQGKPY